jgi:hypothetical protein
MIAFFQLATGLQIRDETIDYIVANNAKAIAKGVKTAFSREMDCLGAYKSHTQGVVDRFGKITLDITYLDQHGDEETTTWQLRPVTLFT